MASTCSALASPQAFRVDGRWRAPPRRRSPRARCRRCPQTRPGRTASRPARWVRPLPVRPLPRLGDGRERMGKGPFLVALTTRGVAERIVRANRANRVTARSRRVQHRLPGGHRTVVIPLVAGPDACAVVGSKRALCIRTSTAAPARAHTRSALGKSLRNHQYAPGPGRHQRRLRLPSLQPPGQGSSQIATLVVETPQPPLGRPPVDRAGSAWAMRSRVWLACAALAASVSPLAASCSRPNSRIVSSMV